MIQILDENRRRTPAENFASAFGGLLQQGNQFMQQQKQMQEQAKQKAAIAKVLGVEHQDLPLEFQKMAYESQLKGNEAAKKLQGEQQEKLQPLQGALDIIGQMRNLRKKNNLGIGATFSPFAETRKQAGEYSQLGKSLIQYATNIPIRNKLEFETLAEELYDPNITDAAAEGVLDAMERIINNSIQSVGGAQGNVQANQPQQQKRPPLTAFQR